MSTPIHHLTKKQLVWLANHRCKHHHNYLDHYSCYKQEQNKEPRIGFYDIETTNLSADFGILLSYCIKVSGEDKIYKGVITKKQITEAKGGDEDKVVVLKCLKDLQNFDTVIGYYSKRFDGPFLRTRALSLGLEFPPYGTLAHIDLYDTVKRKFRLSSNRLKQACKVILGETNKTDIEYRHWRGAARGEEASLAYVLEHNKMDVIDLERLYNKVIQFTRKNDTSL